MIPPVVLGFSIILILLLVLPLVVTVISTLIPKPKYGSVDNLRSITCLLITHEPLINCIPLIQSLKAAKYPDFRIIIVTNQQPNSDFYLHDQNVKVLSLPPENFELSEIWKVLQDHIDPRSGIFFLDLNNKLHPDLLFHLNNYIEKPYAAIQCTEIFYRERNNFLSHTLALIHHQKNILRRYIPFRYGIQSELSYGSFLIKGIWLKKFMDSKCNEVSLKRIDTHIQNFLALQKAKVAYEQNAIVLVNKTSSFGTELNNLLFKVKIRVVRLLQGMFRLNLSLMALGLFITEPPLWLLYGATILTASIFLPSYPLLSICLFAGLLLNIINLLLGKQLIPQQFNILKGLSGLPIYLWKKIDRRAYHRSLNQERILD